MTTSIQNYGFTKTFIRDNNNSKTNDIKWMGNYDGKLAKIDVNIDDNGHKEHIHMQLNNDDILELLGVQPVEMTLENRLKNDFLSDHIITSKQIMNELHKNPRITKTKRNIKNKNKNTDKNKGKTKGKNKGKTRTKSKSKS